MNPLFSLGSLRVVLSRDIQEINREKLQNKQKTQKTTNKMAISTYLLTVNLNVNGLNLPIKRQRVSELISKKRERDPSICCLLETTFRRKETHSKRMCDGRMWLILKNVNDLKPKDSNEQQDVIGRKTQGSRINPGFYLNYCEDGSAIHEIGTQE